MVAGVGLVDEIWVDNTKIVELEGDSVVILRRR
jgi:hypothetical protein